jgi:hypothetical protein
MAFYSFLWFDVLSKGLEAFIEAQKYFIGALKEIDIFLKLLIIAACLIISYMYVYSVLKLFLFSFVKKIFPAYGSACVSGTVRCDLYLRSKKVLYILIPVFYPMV